MSNMQYEEIQYKIQSWIATNKTNILDMNRTLVAIPSENKYPHGDEAEVQKEMSRWLSQLGCEVDVFLPTDVDAIHTHEAFRSDRSYENRPNVVGRKRGSGKGTGKSLIFSGHMDTVPLGTDAWSVAPFSGEVKDDKQYGLGIFDMKSGMVAAVAALKALEELGIKLAGDVLIEAVVDEEFGGANGTLAARLRGYDADLAIIPEPTNLSVCPAHQGGSMYRMTYTGRAGRSFSGEDLVNPVFAAGQFLQMFRQYEIYRANLAPSSPLFDGQPLPACIQAVKAGPVEQPLSDRVPGSCAIDIWIQCAPGVTEEELKQDFLEFYKRFASQDELLKDYPFEFEQLIRFLPGSSIPEGHESLDVIEQVTASSMGQALPVHGAPLACDAFMFNVYSETPAIIWGPSGANAHAPDEYIDIPDFMKLVEMFALTMVKWCGVEAQ